MLGISRGLNVWPTPVRRSERGAATRLTVCAVAGATVLGLVGAYGGGLASRAPADRGTPPGQSAAKAEAQAAYGRLPMSFEVNKGQTDSRVDFLSRGTGYGLFVTPDEAVLSLKRSSAESAPGEAPASPAWDALRMQIVGGDPAAKAFSRGALPGKVNHLVGNDPKKWLTGIPTFGQVGYRGVYPGVDVMYYGENDQLEYDFVVAPGADPATIALGFAGATGVSIADNGDLIVSLTGGELRQTKPRLYQQVGADRLPVDGSFVLKGDGKVGFSVGAYDATRPLVIDPVLAYSTYLGGTATDFGFGIAVDKHGNAYLGGQSGSTNFPSRTAVPGAPLGGDDAYVAKLNPAGNALVYSTFIGGARAEGGWDLGIDSAGNAYLGGSTASGDDPGTTGVEAGFPTTANAFDRTCGSDGFCNGLPAGWFTGFEDDPNTPEDETVPAPCPPATMPAGCVTPPGPADNFLLKLNAAGNSLLYSSFVGGAGDEVSGEASAYPGPLGIAVRGSRAYVSSWTGSTDFPVKNAYQPACASCADGNPDAYLTVLDTSKSGETSLLYSTFLGGNGIDEGKGVAVDKVGMAYVTGTTLDGGNPTVNDFPTRNALQPTYRGGLSDAFVAKLNPAASGPTSLVYSTFLGGGGTEEGWAVAVEDGNSTTGGKAYVTGYTTSGPNPNAEVADDPAPDPQPYFPVTEGSYDTHFEGRATTASGSTLFLDGDAFVVKLKGDGKSLAYSTFLGGPAADYGNGIAVDSKGQAYVTGWTTCRSSRNDNLPRTETFSDEENNLVTVPTGRNPGPASLTGVPDCDAANQAGAFPQVNPIPGEETMDTTPLGLGELHNSPTGVFVTKLLADGVGVAYSVLLDGPGFDRGFALAVRDKDARGNLLGYTDPATGTFVATPEAYVTGRAQVGYVTTAGALQTTFNGGTSQTPGNGRDAFISKVVG